MKNIILTLLLLCAAIFVLPAQYTQLKHTQSSGAGFSQTGNYQSQIIIGQPAGNGGNFSQTGYSGSIGFLTMEFGGINQAPVAEAGENTPMTDPFLEEELIVLDGSQSYDPDGDDLNYHWVSLDGIDLPDSTIVNPVVTAPDVQARRKYRFTLTVDDGELYSNTDTVTIIVSDEDWIPVVYTNSSTMYGVVTLDDIPAESQDQVAAYVDGECRGFIEAFLFQGQAFAVLNISSEIAEQASFKVYDYSNDEICEDTDEVSTIPGSDLGSPSNPIFVAAQCSITTNPFLTVTPSNLNVETSQNCENITIQSNISWTVSASENWISSVSPDNGNGDSSITICFEENTFAGSRTANIEVSGAGLTETITLNQSGNNPDALTFQINDACGTTGEIIQIPVTVEKFNDIFALQKSIRIVDPTFAQFESIEQFGLSGLNVSSFNIMPDVITGAWFSPTGTGISLADNTVLYVINIKILGGAGESSIIQFENTPTATQAFTIDNSLFVEVDLNLVGGIAEVCSVFDLAGEIYNEEDAFVNGVEVNMSGNASDLFITDQAGWYGFEELSAGEDFLIRPAKNSGVSNGVNVVDILHIQRHILGTVLLDSPYKMIAADVDKNGSINVLDLIYIQQLVLTEITAFPNNESWRFVPSDYTFTVPQDPFLDDFPEERAINGMNSDLNDNDFIAIKVGDVDLSSNTSLFTGGNGADNRNALSSLAFSITKEQNENGNLTLLFRGLSFEDIGGFQFTISFDTESLDFQNVDFGNLESLNESNFYLGQSKNGLITVCWHDINGEGVSLDNNEVVFALEFNQSQKNLDITEILNINSELTIAQAFTQNGDLLELSHHILAEDTGKTSLTDTQLFQNRPNPFKENTLIPFYLSKDSHVKLTIVNSLGSVVQIHENEYQKGYHEISITIPETIGGTPFYYKMETQDFQGALPMIKIH